MSSLSELPEVIGFFSYSREDDDAFRGTLSALRDAIQRELGAQLGRSKRSFRLWQDQEAISPGKLWESEIKTAVEQSVFFIPIVTPRLVNSQYCQFEFDAFITREHALGRADLVFPILYIHVPALENETRWRNDPVLSAIGKRQYVDWRPFRHLDIQSTVVREAIERFSRKIVEALHQPWLSPEERLRQAEGEFRQRTEDERRRQEIEAYQSAQEEARRKEDEAEARRIAEERQQQEAEAKRRADEDKYRNRAQAEARLRVEEERRSREAEARQRADQERAFAAARRADDVSAVDQFLASYPESHLAAEAKALHATLVERDDAYKGTTSCDDVKVLRDFLECYPAGKLADEVRRRLRRLERPPRWRPSRRTILLGGGVLGTGTLATVAVVRIQRYGSIRTFGPIRTFTGHTSTVSSVVIAADGTGLSGSWDGTVRLWNLASGTMIRAFEESTDNGVTSVAILPGGRTALSGGWHNTANARGLGTLRLWDLASGGLLHTFMTGPFEVSSAATMPDGRTALSGSSDNSLKIWDLTTGFVIRSLTGHTGAIQSVAIASDGRTALSASNDKTIRLWDLASGGTIRVLSGHTEFALSVSFAPEGRTALSGAADYTIRLWDLESGSVIRILTGHTGGVRAVAIAPDGRMALSGAGDGTLRLWDLSSGDRIRTFTGHDGYVASVAIAPDGRTALSGGYDETLRLWDLT